MSLDMHRTGPTADWETIAPANHNHWQQLAAKTSGVATPGNFFTWLGFLLVMAGLVGLLHHAYIVGLLLIAIGRICDIADGWIAEKTGTKSPFGEKMDASFDKLATLLGIGVLVIVKAVPWWLAAFVIGLQIIISLFAFYGFRAKLSLHPSRIGKLGMAAAWLGFLLALISIIPRSDNQPLHLLANGILFVSVLMALITCVGYARQLRRPTT